LHLQLDDRVRQAIKKILPFHPTAAQKRVLKEIAEDMQKAHPMRRLLQGDVGLRENYCWIPGRDYCD
jgi:RecG-like helicase